MSLLRSAVVLSVVLLAGCGGGGDGAEVGGRNEVARINTAEGIWGGTTNSGLTVGMVILENGDAYGLYTNGESELGILRGNIVGDGSVVRGSGSDYDLMRHTVAHGTVTGSVREKSTIQITTVSGIEFSGTYDHHYDQPASLGALAGNYSLAPQDPEPFVISATGEISAGSEDSDCIVSGKASPRASGKNVFDVELFWNGSACILPHNSRTVGIAMLDTSQVPNLLLTLGNTDDEQDVFVVIAYRR